MTPSLALGGETFWLGQQRKSGTGFAARMHDDKSVATAQVASTGVVSLTYVHRVSEKVSRASSARGQPGVTIYSACWSGEPSVVVNQLHQSVFAACHSGRLSCVVALADADVVLRHCSFFESSIGMACRLRCICGSAFWRSFRRLVWLAGVLGHGLHVELERARSDSGVWL